MFSLGRSRDRSLSAIGALSAAGFAFVLAVTMGAGAGYLLDRWLDTSPWFFLVFFFFGLAAGVLNVFRMSAGYVADSDTRGGSGPPADRT